MRSNVAIRPAKVRAESEDGEKRREVIFAELDTGAQNENEKRARGVTRTNTEIEVFRAHGGSGGGHTGSGDYHEEGYENSPTETRRNGGEARSEAKAYLEL